MMKTIFLEKKYFTGFPFCPSYEYLNESQLQNRKMEQQEVEVLGCRLSRFPIDKVLVFTVQKLALQKWKTGNNFSLTSKKQYRYCKHLLQQFKRGRKTIDSLTFKFQPQLWRQVTERFKEITVTALTIIDILVEKLNKIEKL